MPSFQWGALPQPSLGEYMRRQNHYDLIYSAPYYLAALVITLIGFGITPLILRRVRGSELPVFRDAAATTLALLLLVAIASDVGTLLGIWRGPAFVLHHYWDLFSIWALCKSILPGCILSGLAASANRWSNTHGY
jgi:hypothetical protein